MKPIRSTYNYTVEVDYDFNNPEHAPFAGLPIAIEKRQIHGFITDIIQLKGLVQTVGERETRSINGSLDVKEKRESSAVDGVYVVFWADTGTNYKLMVEDFSRFTVSYGEMRNYVAAYNV